MTSKKISKEFCGVMFAIIVDPDGKKVIVPTKDALKAVDIVIPKTKRRCPYCHSNKCLENILGESIAFRDYFPKAAKTQDTRYLDIAVCRKLGKEFILARNMLAITLERKRCIWCGSTHITPIPNPEKLRESFLEPSKIKNYRFVIWEDPRGDEFGIPEIEGMTIDEKNIFTYTDPYKCEQCKRVFGYEPAKGELFATLLMQILLKDMKIILEKLSLSENAFAIEDKCPFCSSDIDYKNWFLENVSLPEETSLLGRKKKSLVEINKYRCSNCNRDFIAPNMDFDF